MQPSTVLIETPEDDGLAAVLAHLLLNTLACLRMPVETLADPSLELDATSRAVLGRDAGEQFVRVESLCRAIIRGGAYIGT